MSFSIGFLFAFGNSLFESLMDAARKRGSQKFDAWTAAWGMRFFGVVILLPIALFLKPTGFPHDRLFWIALVGSVAINTVTSVLYMHAVQISPLSLVLPIVTLSPVFLLVTSPIINGEFPSLLGIAGVLLTTMGTYTLNLDKVSENIFAPFTFLWKEKGTRAMLFVALLWGVSAPLDKLAIQHADPYWYAALANALLTIALFPLMLRWGATRLAVSRTGFAYLAPIGLLSAASVLCQFIAFSLIIVPYAVGIKRTSVIFGAIWGKLFFHEEKFKMRFVAALLMCAGTIVIIVAGLTR